MMRSVCPYALLVALLVLINSTGVLGTNRLRQSIQEPKNPLIRKELIVARRNVKQFRDALYSLYYMLYV